MPCFVGEVVDDLFCRLCQDGEGSFTIDSFTKDGSACRILDDDGHRSRDDLEGEVEIGEGIVMVGFLGVLSFWREILLQNVVGGQGDRVIYSQENYFTLKSCISA